MLAQNGDASPVGGNFVITAPRVEVLINNQSDVAFRSDIANSATTNSAYFIRRGPGGAVHPVAMQGQAAPGTAGGSFDTIQTSLNSFLSENFQLSQDGELAFANFFITPSVRALGVWRVKQDDSVEEILVRGLVAPQFGGGKPVVSTTTLTWNSRGRFAVWARVSGGTLDDGIFLSTPIAATTTPAGTSVPIAPIDSTTGTTPVTMTFDNVTSPGVTSVTSSAGGPAIPTAFQLGDPPLFFNIETTAAFSGPVQVCFDISALHFSPGANLRLLHFAGAGWQDVTTNVTATQVCGITTSLSPFTVAAQIAPPDLDNDGVTEPPDNCPGVSNPDQLDTDHDGAGNACDSDDDNDGVPDVNDAFPLDPTEWVDTDHDGIGNNADLDDDNDGQSDVNELACGSNPLSAASKSPDQDHDNIPDCVDPDIDGDGIPNSCDIDQNPGARDYDHDGIVDGSGCDTVIGPPTNKDQCKNGGWQFWTRRDGSIFKNQGDCVSFTNNGK
ncbi:MAG: thrombospondin type 3 repeat-containing protein [Acidobacteria bacterium]|nr:thrombospondin type 3 repeat-containing protein [Acidobacteriota bacterium]